MVVWCGCVVAFDESVVVQFVDEAGDVGVGEVVWFFDDIPLDCWLCHCNVLSLGSEYQDSAAAIAVSYCWFCG